MYSIIYLYNIKKHFTASMYRLRRSKRKKPAPDIFLPKPKPEGKNLKNKD